MIAEAYRIRAVAFETPAEATDAEQQEAAKVGGNLVGEEGEGGGAGRRPPRKNDGSLDFGRRGDVMCASVCYTLDG